MSRAEALVPEGWKPRVGSVVIVEATKDDPYPPHGLWKVISAAPGSGQWWLLPVDDASREWRDRWPGQVVTGFIMRSGRVLLPKGTRRPRPSDMSPAALQRMAAGGRR